MGVVYVLWFPFREACLLGAGGLALAEAFITWEVAPIEMDMNAAWKMRVLDFS